MFVNPNSVGEEDNCSSDAKKFTATMSGDESSSDSQQSPTSSSMDIDNSSTVISKIANLYAERLMSDVCLVVGNVEYPSHRLILCASSDVFQVSVEKT